MRFAWLAAFYSASSDPCGFLDFKSNEYAKLLAGADFEPTKRNPMIGWRGASPLCERRASVKACPECAALRHVREGHWASAM